MPNTPPVRDPRRDGYKDPARAGEEMTMAKGQQTMGATQGPRVLHTNKQLDLECSLANPRLSAGIKSGVLLKNMSLVATFDQWNKRWFSSLVTSVSNF